MLEFEKWVEKAERLWGRPTLDLTEVMAVDPDFRRFFHGPRIEVTTTYESGETFVRRGRVSVTTGWRPALLLVHRRSDSGSWDVLSPRDKVTAVISK